MIEDELETQEKHENAVIASMFSALQPAVDTYCLDADNADSFESLKGPAESGWIDVEDIRAEEPEIHMTWEELKKWYFGNIDSFRMLLQIMRRAAKRGNTLEQADLDALKDGLRKLDLEAFQEGWDFVEHPTTSIDRLANEFASAELLTVEYRTEQIAKEKAARAAYLIKVGKLVRKEVIA